MQTTLLSLNEINTCCVADHIYHVIVSHPGSSGNARQSFSCISSHLWQVFSEKMLIAIKLDIDSKVLQEKYSLSFFVWLPLKSQIFTAGFHQIIRHQYVVVVSNPAASGCPLFRPMASNGVYSKRFLLSHPYIFICSPMIEILTEFFRM